MKNESGNCNCSSLQHPEDVTGSLFKTIGFNLAIENKSIASRRSKKGKECATNSPPYMELPDFRSISFNTQLCFAMEYGIWDWPETDCCSPPINQVDTCVPLDGLLVDAITSAVPIYTFTEENLSLTDSTPIQPEDIDPDDRRFFGAAMSILLMNKDIAFWVTCLVGKWSPETRKLSLKSKGLQLKKRLKKLLTKDVNGKFPFTVSYILVGLIEKSSLRAITEEWIGNGLGFDHVGLVIALTRDETGLWNNRILDWKNGTSEEAFCAIVRLAASLLHELIHICGDHIDNGAKIVSIYNGEQINAPGTKHEEDADGNDIPFPCWDECRMIASMFLYFMAQRYPCLTSTSSSCSCMDSEFFFAYSTNSIAQMEGIENEDEEGLGRC